MESALAQTNFLEKSTELGLSANCSRLFSWPRESKSLIGDLYKPALLSLLMAPSHSLDAHTGFLAGAAAWRPDHRFPTYYYIRRRIKVMLDSRTAPPPLHTRQVYEIPQTIESHFGSHVVVIEDFPFNNRLWGVTKVIIRFYDCV